jgi:drug/metabolite transporter (DMT)-like permease
MAFSNPGFRNILPYLALAAGILSLGFSAIFVTWANAPGPVMAFYRIGIATLILSPFFYKTQRGRFKLTRIVLIFPIIGGLFTALDHAVWNTAVLYTTAANATLLGNTAPLWVALTAWLIFKERLEGLFWAGLALALTGAAVVLGYDFLIHPSLGLGDILAMLAGFFYAGYLVITQMGRRHLATVSYIWIVNLSSTAFLLVMSLALGMPLTGYSGQTYLAFLGAAVVSQILGYLSIAYALGRLPASVVSPTILGQPVVTALLAAPLLGEHLQPYQGLGGLTVLAGIFLVHKSREAVARKTSAEEVDHLAAGKKTL